MSPWGMNEARGTRHEERGLTFLSGEAAAFSAGDFHSGFFFKITKPSRIDVSGRYSSEASSALCQRETKHLSTTQHPQ